MQYFNAEPGSAVAPWGEWAYVFFRNRCRESEELAESVEESSQCSLSSSQVSGFTLMQLGLPKHDPPGLAGSPRITPMDGESLQ